MAIAIAYTFYKAWNQLAESEFDFQNIKWHYLLASMVAYAATMLLSATVWHRILVAIGQKPVFLNSLLAFFASQLGKYIPGKAMVVVIRTDMIRGDDVRTAPAAASVFVETLAWIFVGSVIGGGMLLFQYPDQLWLKVAAVSMAVVAGILTWPPIFKSIANRLANLKSKKAVKILDGLNVPTMLFSWIVMSLGWVLNGFSLWLVMLAITPEVQPADFGLTLTCVCLATVAGFVSLLPGGIGVRELVMIPLLGAKFGTVPAVVAAILIRVVWLTTELLVAGIIFLTRRLR